MPTLDTHRAPIRNILRSPRLLRNVVYGVVIFLVLSSLLYRTTPSDIASIIPHYAKPSGLDAQQDVSAAEWSRRAEQVRHAFRHAYGNYERYAAPHDELKPLSQGKVDKYAVASLFATFSLTMVV